MKIIFGKLVDVSLVEASGRMLELYLHNGRYFVEAKDLQEYRLKVRARAPRRVEVLTSIDGFNTLLDEAAHLSLSRGMVINGYSTYDVTGWRIDDSHTRPFIFTVFDEETVAKQATGSSKNLGVIAVATYLEYQRPVRSHIIPFSHGESIKGGFGSLGTVRGVGVGTGMGDRLDRDEVGHTTFYRQTDTPEDVIEILAMPGWWLEREGIKSSCNDGFPHGFDGDGGDTGYGKYRKVK